jgi:DNA-binding NarL/FixJ family response regulator
MFLARADDIRVVGEASDGPEALSLAAALQPDILLLDIKMPGPTGLEVLPTIQVQSPRTKVLIVSGFLEDKFLIEALGRGAKGYLLKTATHKHLVKAVRALHAGEIWAERKMLTQLLESLLRKLSDLYGPLSEAHASLTDREREKATSMVVYDNVPGTSDDIDAANPQAIAGGSIVIHSQ